MILTEEDYRAHMDGMIQKGQHDQARFWAENGTLIYSNYDKLMRLYEDEYQDQLEER